MKPTRNNSATDAGKSILPAWQSRCASGASDVDKEACHGDWRPGVVVWRGHHPSELPMRFRDIFQLEESTARLGNFIYNLLVKALIFSLAIVGYAALAIGLNFLFEVGASLLGFDDKTSVLLKAGSGLFFVILVVTTVLFGIGDILKLNWYYLRHEGRGNGRD